MIDDVTIQKPDDIESYLDPAPKPKLRRIVRGADKLTGVQPELVNHFNNLDEQFQAAGITPEIKSGFRTTAQQQALYNNPATRARTKGNDGITKISPHQRGEALDISFAAPQRARGRQIIANYAQANGLQVPSDEPWHVGLRMGGQQAKPAVPDVENYLDPQPKESATQAAPNVEDYLDPQQPLSTAQAGIEGQKPLKTPRVTSTVKDVDTGEELPTMKPIQFQPSKSGEGLNRLARAAGELAETSNMQDLKLPANHPDLLGQHLEAKFDHQPTQDEVDAALLEQLGKGYGSVGQKFKSETGQSLTANGAAVEKQSDGSYIVHAKPTQGFIDAVNAYVQGGRSAYESTLASQAVGKGLVARDLRNELKARQGVAQDVGQAGAREVAKDLQLVQNAADLVRGRAPEDDVNARAIGRAEESIPRSSTWTGAAADTALGTLGTINRAEALGGGAMFPAEQALENIHRGPEAAYKAGILAAPMLAIGPTARAVGADEMSGLGRQLTTRGIGAAELGGAAAATGAPLKEVGQSALMGAAFPTGERQPERDVTAPVRGREQAGAEQAYRTADVRGRDQLGIERAQTVPDFDAQLAAREAAVKPVTDADGNVLLNPDEVAQGGKPKVKLANKPSEVAHPSNFQVRDEGGKFDGPVVYPDEFQLENVSQPATSEPITPAQSANEVPREPPQNLPTETATTPQSATTVSTPAIAQGKEPWEMTRAEYSDAATEATREANRPGSWIIKDAKSGKVLREVFTEPKVDAAKYTVQPISEYLASLNNQTVEPLDVSGLREGQLGNIQLRHRNLVERALREDKPVPENVLSDYPDLKAKYGVSTRTERRFAEGQPPEGVERRRGLLENSTPEEIKAATEDSQRLAQERIAAERERAAAEQVQATLAAKGEPQSASDQVTTPETTIPKAAESGAQAPIRSLAGTEVKPLVAKPTVEPDFVKAARDRVAQREAHFAGGGKEFGSGGPDTQAIIDRLIVHGYDFYTKNKPRFEEWAAEMKRRFGDDVTEYLRGVYNQIHAAMQSGEKNLLGEPAEPSPGTSAAKAAVDLHREARGAEPLPWSPKSKADETLLSTAKEANDKEPLAPGRLTKEVLAKPRALSDAETVQLDLHKQSLSSELSELTKKANETDDPAKLKEMSVRAEQIEKEFDDTDRAWRLSGTEKGRSLRAQRVTVNQNYDLLPMLGRFKLKTGEAPTPEIRKQIEDFQEKIAAQGKVIAEQREALQKRETETATRKLVRETQFKQRGQARTASRKVLDDDFAVLKSDFAAAWKKVGRPGTFGAQAIDPEGVLTKTMLDMARNRISAGYIDAEGLVDHIHQELSDVVDISRRQVAELFSSYGKIRQPKADPVEKKLNELREIQRNILGKADIVEKGIRALKSGGQQQKPSEDLRRAVRELNDAMAEHGTKLGEQPRDLIREKATPLDKAKTTVRNRLEQLQSQIDAGKKETRPGRAEVIPDAELGRLRTQAEALRKVVDLLDDPQADQKAVETRLAQLDKDISKTRARMAVGDVTPQVKEGQKSTYSPEIATKERERIELNRALRLMRSEAEKTAPEGTVEYARRLLRQQRAFDVRTRSAISELERRLREGDTSKPEKPTPRVLEDKEAQQQLKLNRLKRDYDSWEAQQEGLANWQKRPWYSKLGAYTAAGVRASVLSGTKTIGKIGSALAQRTAQQYPEEAFARVGKRFAPKTAEMAARYGGHMNVASEKAFAGGFGRGVTEIPKLLATGETELSKQFHDRHAGIPTKLGKALEVPGRVHYAEKYPLMRGEYERSRELLLQRAERLKPGSRTNPVVIDAAEQQAYENAKEVILLGDNPFSRRFSDAQLRMGQESRDLTRTIVPVHRVAGNYLHQMIAEYGAGVFRGAVRAFAERNPEKLAKMTPADAEKTMRLLQRGSLGLVYMALAGSGVGGALGVKFGGFYKPGKKQKEGEPKFGDIKIGPATISHTWLHSPPDELAQLTASIRQEWQDQAAKDKGKGAASRLWSGAARGGLGIVEQTPFVNDLTQLADSLRGGDSLAAWTGREVASRTQPQILRDITTLTDRTASGEPRKRKATGFTNQFKTGIPGLRQTVPISDVFGAKASVGSDEVQRLNLDIKGAQKQPDESPKEFAERQQIINPAIKKAVDEAVTRTYMFNGQKVPYDKLPDDEKAYQIKQAKTDALDEVELPEKPEKPEESHAEPIVAPVQSQFKQRFKKQASSQFKNRFLQLGA